MGAGSRHRRGGWNAPGRWLEEVALRGSGGHRERISKNSGSGARALRKYACNAGPIRPKRQTVHVSVKPQ
eukprot:3790213-Pleurochrysis_carterae.AAC.1